MRVSFRAFSRRVSETGTRRLLEFHPPTNMSNEASLQCRLTSRPNDDDGIMNMTADEVHVEIDNVKRQQKITIGCDTSELFQREWEGSKTGSPFTFICTQFNILAEVSEYGRF